MTCGQKYQTLKSDKNTTELCTIVQLEPVRCVQRNVRSKSQSGQSRAPESCRSIALETVWHISDSFVSLVVKSTVTSLGQHQYVIQAPSSVITLRQTPQAAAVCICGERSLQQTSHALQCSVSSASAANKWKPQIEMRWQAVWNVATSNFEWHFLKSELYC